MACLDCGQPGHTHRCPTCLRASRGGSTSERDYGAEHQAERARWRPKVEAGEVDCRRDDQCVAPDLRIRPDEPWDLGHPTAECPAPRAPEHRRCNRGTNRPSM